MRKHSVCIHPGTYSSKPKKFAGYISAQIAKHSVDIYVEELASALGCGQSWTPSTFHNNKRTLETFKQMSVIAVDIDKWNVELTDILQVCANHDISPIIVHESFSSTAKARKWRVIFQLENSITNIDEAYHAIGVLAAIFNADPSCVEPARFLYGTTTDKIHIVEPDACPIALSWFTNKETLKIKSKKKVIKGEVREEPRDRIYTSDLSLLQLVINDCKELIAEPPNSRYQALWNSARKLSQLDHFSYEQIMQALLNEVSKNYEVWNDWDKDLEKTIDNGIKWGVNHLREDIQ